MSFSLIMVGILISMLKHAPSFEISHIGLISVLIQSQAIRSLCQDLFVKNLTTFDLGILNGPKLECYESQGTVKF